MARSIYRMGSMVNFLFSLIVYVLREVIAIPFVLIGMVCLMLGCMVGGQDVIDSVKSAFKAEKL